MVDGWGVCILRSTLTTDTTVQSPPAPLRALHIRAALVPALSMIFAVLASAYSLAAYSHYGPIFMALWLYYPLRLFLRAASILAKFTMQHLDAVWSYRCECHVGNAVMASLEDKMMPLIRSNSLHRPHSCVQRGMGVRLSPKHYVEAGFKLAAAALGITHTLFLIVLDFMNISSVLLLMRLG